MICSKQEKGKCKFCQEIKIYTCLGEKCVFPIIDKYKMELQPVKPNPTAIQKNSIVEQ